MKLTYYSDYMSDESKEVILKVINYCIEYLQNNTIAVQSLKNDLLDPQKQWLLESLNTLIEYIQ